MANLVSKELRTAILQSYFNRSAAPVNLYVHLFQDAAPIIETTTMASLSIYVQTGSGYAPKVIGSADWTVEQGTGGTRARLADQTWTSTADNWGTLRWAVISDQPDYSGQVLLARDYGTGKSIYGVGANITVDDLFYQLND